MNTIKSFLTRCKTFCTSEIWHLRPDRPSMGWIVTRLARTILLAARGFRDHHGPLRASALTFYTLLSLVPLAAMAFGIAKGFGFERLLEKELLEQFSAQQAVVQQVIVFARNMLDNTQGGLIAGIGVIALFWSVVKVLGNIEDSFNHIWGVASRPILRKLSDYLTIMIIGPVLLITSGSVTVLIAAQVAALSSHIGLQDVLNPAISGVLALAPYMLLWILFTLIYLIMPNTRVKASGAILAAIMAGSVYQLVQIGYVRFQINVTSYNAIYGSFAALPLFLVWLNLSWHIVLFGAEIAHAFQHADMADHTQSGQRMSMRQTRLFALALCTHVVRLFHRGEPARSCIGIARDLALAPGLIRFLADLLVRGGILSRVDDDDGKEQLLQPARDISSLTIAQVMAAVENVGTNDLLPPGPGHLQPGPAWLDDLLATIDRSPASRLVLEL